MRKLLLSIPVLALGALAGSANAAPLSITGTLATSPAINEALGDQGATQVRWHHRHYHGYRPRYYGYYYPYHRRHHHHRRVVVIYR
jgi:hypothetical protein